MSSPGAGVSSPGDGAGAGGRGGELGRGAQFLLPARSIANAAQRQCKLLEWPVRPSLLFCFRGCVLCQAQGNPIFKPGSKDGLSIEGECLGCQCRDLGGGVVLSLHSLGEVPGALAVRPGTQGTKRLCVGDSPRTS